MSHFFSQPEEIDLVLLEMARNGEDAKVTAADRARFDCASWSGSYITPYRAALMKTLGFRSTTPLPPTDRG